MGASRPFYLAVEVLERRMLKVQIEAEHIPNKEEMQEILENAEFIDITDDETLGYESVDSIEQIGR